MLKMGLISCLSTDCKTDTLLTSAHNDADDSDDADTADDYNRMIGIALLKAFSCANYMGARIPPLSRLIVSTSYN